MPTPQLQLFHYWRSSCSWRVRWALNIKGLSYESTAVDLLKKEHKSPEFLQMNPSGLVPALRVDNRYIGQSTAIVEWLEEVFPQPALLPKDSWQRALIREFNMMIGADIQPIANLRVQHYYSDAPEKRTAWAQHFISEGFRPVEKKLAEHGGKFCFGDSVTMADLYLIPQVFNALRFQVDLTEFPHARRIYEHCLTTEACAKAAPENQPGAF